MSYFKKAFVDANLTKEKTRMYGVYKGYNVYVGYATSNGRMIVKVAFSGGMDGASERIKMAVERAVSDEKKPPVVSVAEHTVIIDNPGNFQLKKICEVAEKYVEAIVRALMTENCKGGCECCGAEANVGYYEIDAASVGAEKALQMLCPNCLGKLEASLGEVRQGVRAEKSSLVLGLIGAFLGCLLGVALWVLIWMLGYIAGIAGAAMIVLAMGGYRKFGKALDIKGVVASFLMSIVMIFVANQLSWSITIYMEIADSGFGVTVFDIYRNFFELMQSADLMGDFIVELFAGYFLFLIAGISSVARAFKAARGNYKIKRL